MRVCLVYVQYSRRLGTLPFFHVFRFLIFSFSLAYIRISLGTEMGWIGLRKGRAMEKEGGRRMEDSGWREEGKRRAKEGGKKGVCCVFVFTLIIANISRRDFV